MVTVLSAWLVIQLFAIAALPLAWRLLAALPDRGYAFAKALGLLLVSYTLWMGSSFGFLNNDLGGVLFGLIALIALSLWWGGAGLRREEEGERPLWVWLKANRSYILTVEALFFLALVAWAFFRSYNPELNSTEKPMELAFLNGILQSPRFPPVDPWLSGFSISYYYFGYVMLSVLVRMTGMTAAVGFNVGQAIWFGLVVVGAYGVAYNLMAAAATKRRVLALALLGPLLVVGIGNLEGAFEIAHAKGIGGSAVYEWLDVNNLSSAPLSDTWHPQDNWWWWRASRVINDRDLSGTHVEVIDEFPFFSYLLGDMHPHVLTLPFVLLAISLALNLMLSARPAASSSGSTTEDVAGIESDGIVSWLPLLDHWVRRAWRALAVATGLGNGGILLYALLLGGLSFLNTWDFPIYLFLLMLAYAVRRAHEVGRLDGGVVGETVLIGLTLGVLGGLLYLPFYLGFSSQAGGFRPNLLFPTQLRQFLLMFGTFVIPLVSLLVLTTRRQGRQPVSRTFWRILVAAVALPLIFILLLLGLSAVLPGGLQYIQSLLDNPAIQNRIGGRSLVALALFVLRLRVLNPFVYLLLAAGLAWVGALIWRAIQEQAGDWEKPDPTTLFVLLMMGIAFLLTFAVEFVFLKDNFNTRMNTVFKFYYQGWVLMALASAYAIYRLLSVPGMVSRLALAATGVLVVLSLYYPVASAYSKANGFRGEPTLDGLAYFQRFRPDEAAAIEWLRENVPPGTVVLEARGDSYRAETSRVSAQTGLPTLLGWGGHEAQWRGSYEEPGRREPVIQAIYTTSDSMERQRLLQEYGVDYVFVGQIERNRFNLNDAALARLAHSMDLAYENVSVVIFRQRDNSESGISR